MKPGQHVYIPGEKIDTPVQSTLIRGGRAEIEKVLNETDTTYTCLVYFLDGRYENSTQRLFFKNNLPQQLTKEKIMATRKAQKKVAKKVVKKVVKKAVKKTDTKPAEKPVKKTEGKSDVVPLSRFISKLIVQSNISDEKIVERTQVEYPKYKHTDVKTVSYYRNFINLGKMEKSGFPKPKTPYEPTGGKKVAKKPEEKKTPSRKTATRRK